MTVIENVDKLDDLLNKAKNDVRWRIVDINLMYYDELYLEITSLGEANQILMYRKWPEERRPEPLSEYEVIKNLSSQKLDLERFLRREQKRFRSFRNKEAIDVYEDDLRKIEVEMAKLVKQNKADCKIFNLQRKEEKNKLKAFALSIPNIKKGYYEAK